MELQYRRHDGSFVARVNGLPYHIVEGDVLFEVAQANGSGLPFEPEPEIPALTVDDYRRAIQWHIDTTVQERGYDSGVTCSSYANSTNPTWSAEAAAFIAWRDSVWSHANAELAKVQSGQRATPAIEVILAEFPPMNWPV